MFKQESMQESRGSIIRVEIFSWSIVIVKEGWVFSCCYFDDPITDLLHGSVQMN